MGIYCNPANAGDYKQEYFKLAARNGEIIRVTDLPNMLQYLDALKDQRYYGVCVVSNGMFDAAGVLHPLEETKETWSYPDQRMKTFYVCSRKWLVEQDYSLATVLPE